MDGDNIILITVLIFIFTNEQIIKMKTYGFILLILHIIPMGAWFFLLFITNDENKVEKIQNHIVSIFPLWLNWGGVMIAMALLPLLIWSFNGIFFGFFLLIYAFGVYNYLHLLYSISPFYHGD